jgi:16S rRNA (cytosine1402-N4)-methyltransferase
VNQVYHTPVLCHELTEAILVNSPKLVVDATLGGGGHALAMLQKAPAQTMLFGIDRDDEAIVAATTTLAAFGERVKILKGNFRSIKDLITEAGFRSVDAIYADLGVSSHQIDAQVRGFSYLNDGPLDMRMDQKSQTSAADLLRDLSAEELGKIFHDYGEERVAKRIARRIEKERQRQPLLRTSQLAAIIEAAVPGKMKIKSLSRIFQALRIAVNDELAALAEFLNASLSLLTPGGALAIISYHSLEDRQVKNFFRQKEKGCVCPPEAPVCVCGKKSELAVLTRKAVQPSEEEQLRNPRARSARLRIAQKREGG